MLNLLLAGLLVALVFLVILPAIGIVITSGLAFVLLMVVVGAIAVPILVFLGKALFGALVVLFSLGLVTFILLVVLPALGVLILGSVAFLALL